MSGAETNSSKSFLIKKDSKVPLDTKQSERRKRMIAVYKQYAKEREIKPVSEDWNTWHSFSDKKKQK
jgi:hypothetical protein